MSFEIREACQANLGSLIFHLPKLSLDSGEVALLYGPTPTRLDLLLRLFSGSLPQDSRMVSVTNLHSLPLYINNSHIYSDTNIHKRIGSVFSDPDVNILGRTIIEDFYNALVAVDATPEEQITVFSLRPYGLSEKLYRETDALSGGEKQRLNCATALVGTRKLFVGDFTTATLDRDFLGFMLRAVKDFVGAGGVALLGGVDPEEGRQFKKARFLKLQWRETNLQVDVSKGGPDPRYFPGRSIESNKLKKMLM